MGNNSEKNHKHPGGRPTEYNEKLHPLFVKALAKTGKTEDEIAKEMGVSKATITNWKRDYPEFLAAIKEGKNIPDDLVENALYKRALGYKYKEVTRERLTDSGQKERHGGISKLTAKEWEHAKEHFGEECAYCGAAGSLTKDHVIPLESGGELTCTNVVPACGKCNSAKKAYDIEEWYRRQKFFSEARLAAIRAYIESMESKTMEAAELVVSKVVTKELPPDTMSMIYWLNNRRPDRWKHRQSIEHSGEITTISMTPEELDKRLDELEKKRNGEK